eukprot:TRINITY_DN4846_c0_g2_i1.p1 TRINITY_DN4846_c0_g2~~TRINITY_DN4846_c0_g2_i1.p1  ORF type:complete len:293 (+),score=27.74 TRINITY_DN4846_c0_g2_i1:116-994(+)
MVKPFEDGQFVNDRGQRLRYRKYEPVSDIKGIFVFHGGFREHLDRKTWLLSTIAAEGYVIFHMEPHGHGLSEPMEPKHVRYTTDSVFHYVDDFIKFVNDIVEPFKENTTRGNDLPVYIGGMSMGGEIATLVAIQQKSKYAGLVLACPSIDVDRNIVMRIQEMFADFLVMLIPYQRLVPAVPIEAITLEPDVQESIANDNMMEKGPVAVKQGYHLLQGFKHIAAHEHELTLPILISMGSEDGVISTNGINRFLKNVSSKDSTLYTIQGGYHAIDCGAHKEEFAQSIIDWLNEH